MATQRDRPYGAFNYLVSWDGLDENSVQGGFMEVSGLGLDVQVVEYRAGNSKTNDPIKVTGLSKTPDVTLKRGVIGSLDLYAWLDEIRNGAQDALRDVMIRLLSEDRAEIAQEWRLHNARPVRYTGPHLDARACHDVAIEELTLACERLEIS